MLPSAYYPSVGGVEVLTAQLSRALVKAGHQVEVWTARSDDRAAPETEHVDGITVRRFLFTAPRMSARALMRAVPQAWATYLGLLRAHRAFGPDVLHVQCFGVNGAYATALSRRTGTPLVVSLHGETVMDDHDIYEQSVFLRTALRSGLRRAVRVTGCSQFTLDDAARFGLDMTKADVIFNGVDQDEVPPEPVAVPFPRYVAALGRVVDKKGFDLLIDAFAEVAMMLPDLGLVIAGEGDALPGLRIRAKQAGIEDRVHFPGRLNRAQVAGLLSGAESFVMPSRLEPFGIVALEAWRAGLPIVVTTRGGAREFVEHERSGLVIDPTDPGALAGALLLLAGSADVRRSLAVEGQERLPEFSWDRVRAQYETVYQRAAAVGRASEHADEGGRDCR
jgi:glycogen(starch) synthase